MAKLKLSHAIAAAALAVTAIYGAPQSWAAGAHGAKHGSDTTMKIGMPGKASAATRTINVVMTDNAYDPKSIAVKEGETVRFVVRNAGEFVHEFAIATGALHEAHRPEMMKMMENGILEADRINWDAAKKMQATMGHGMHKEANSQLLEPGKTGEIIWTFPKHAKLEFACNVPGHYETGMVGKFKLKH